MDNVSIKLLDDKSVVTFRGVLNINNIVDIKQELEELITFEQDLDVQIELPETIDITFIQMLVAMRNSCLGKKAKFSIKSQLSDDVFGLMKNAGLDEFLNN